MSQSQQYAVSVVGVAMEVMRTTTRKMLLMMAMVTAMVMMVVQLTKRTG
jgi:hypothetical protein